MTATNRPEARSEGRPGRVLVVDDDTDVRETVVTTLEVAGFRVLETDNPHEGLALLRAHPDICLVLLDLMMPTMTGFQFRDEQRRDTRIAAIPTVIVTGSPVGAEERDRLQATDYLSKPVSRADLLAVVATYCEPTRSDR